MIDLPPWPPPLLDHLRRTDGDPVAVDRLGGMSEAAVWRVAFADSSVVVKIGPRSHEANFYRHVAPGLRQQGVPIPELERAGQTDDIHWLIIEDVPAPLPKTRWLADSEVLRALRRLHTATWGRPPQFAAVFQPTWTAAETRAALTRFSPEVAAEIDPLLQALRAESAHLFRPRCAISGDPNPNNWGVRAEGQVVLYDWERFGSGTPALDLAISVPGLGNPDEFRLVAERYAAADADTATAESAPGFVDPSAHDIGLAKVWNVVDFLGVLGQQPGDRTSAVADWLTATVPDWIRRVHHDLL